MGGKLAMERDTFVAAMIVVGSVTVLTVILSACGLVN